MSSAPSKRSPFANTFGVLLSTHNFIPGFHPGLELANAFGVTLVNRNRNAVFKRENEPVLRAGDACVIWNASARMWLPVIN